MKKGIIRLVTLALMFSVTILKTQAQDETQKPKMTAEQRTDKRLKGMTKKLSLSKEQVAQMKPLILAQENIRESHMKEVKESHQKMMGEMEKILSPEQMAQFKKLQEQRKEKRKEHIQKERKEMKERE